MLFGVACCLGESQECTPWQYATNGGITIKLEFSEKLLHDQWVNKLSILHDAMVMIHEYIYNNYWSKPSLDDFISQLASPENFSCHSIEQYTNAMCSVIHVLV
jgi:hypothetical protein